MLPILHQSFWRDEALSVFLAEKPLTEIFHFVTKDVQAPLYYFILHYWMLSFGNTDVAVRSLSVVFHLALGILVFFFIRYLTKNTFVSIAASLATLFNPMLLSYSFEARPYALLAFLLTLAMYLFVTKRFFLASITFSLAILTHNFSLFSLVGISLYWLVAKGKDLLKRDGATIKETYLFFNLPYITAFLWGVFVLQQFRRATESFWINATTTGIFLETFEKFFAGVINYDGKEFLLTIVFILTGFVIASWIVPKKSGAFKEAPLFLFVALTPIIISYIISSLWVPNFHERYIIASVPLLILFSTVSLYQLWQQADKKLSYVIVSLIVLYLVLSVQAAEKIVRTPTKPPINYAVGEILKKATIGDIIVPKDYLNFLETKYYVRQAGSSIPVYAISSTGEIPWYANALVIDPSEIIKELPKSKRTWQVNPDGGYELLK